MSDNFFAVTKISTGRFSAKYVGRCSLDTCEKRNEIDLGDACEYVDDELYHLTCAGRVKRGEQLCGDCQCYHAGEC